MEPSSPQPSIDRLSVTFAIAEDQKIADSHEGDSTPSTRMQQHLANEQLNNNNEMQRNTTSAAGLCCNQVLLFLFFFTFSTIFFLIASIY